MTKKEKDHSDHRNIGCDHCSRISTGIYLYINRFDAGEYVQAVLDTSYKNETDQYVEITGMSQEEAEKIFEDNLDITMAGFESSEMRKRCFPNTENSWGDCRKSQLYYRKAREEGEWDICRSGHRQADHAFY